MKMKFDVRGRIQGENQAVTAAADGMEFVYQFQNMNQKLLENFRGISMASFFSSEVLFFFF